MTPQGIRSGLVVFADKILAIEPFDTVLPDVHLTDAAEHVLLPGLVDVHTHLNEPGRTGWEGFITGTRAAAAGGYTCIVDMPLNCIPSTTTVEALEQKRAAVSGKSMVDYAFWGGAVESNVAELMPLARSGVRGFKAFLIHPGTDEFEMITEPVLRKAMSVIAQTGLPLLVHAELPGPVSQAHQTLSAEGADWRKYQTYLRSRPAASEVEAIRLLIRLCQQLRCPVHVVHLSAAEALQDLRTARAEGLPITIETCPHYLFFSSESIPDGATQFKCTPPIRNRDNQAALWQALGNGAIDFIATDHSPCPPALKLFDSGDFRNAWGGISSLSVSLPATWTAALSRGFTLSDIARWMSEGPAKLAGLSTRKGQIAPGYDADFLLFDPAAEFRVASDQLHFRHPCSPYTGELLKGLVLTTYVRGNICWNGQAFPRTPPGIELRN